MRVALLGTGRIGVDLLVKLQRSRSLSCVLVAGRRPDSDGLQFAAARGLPTTAGAIDALIDRAHEFDLVFDATNALAHPLHWNALRAVGKTVIDLTPSKLGHMVVPTVNGDEALEHDNINLVTCGGQAAIPLLHAITRAVPDVTYAELVTTASSPSVGRATRQNLDEYVWTTEAAMRQLTGVEHVKCMLNVSPAVPPAPFRNTVAVSLGTPLRTPVEQQGLLDAVQRAVDAVHRFAEGYRLVAATMMDPQRLLTTVTVTGRGDVLPAYAGNLDIINDAAVRVAERIAASNQVRA